MRLIATRAADLEEIKLLCGVQPRKSYFKQENSLNISVIIPMWLTGLCPKAEFLRLGYWEGTEILHNADPAIVFCRKIS